jgi:plastocyanin
LSAEDLLSRRTRQLCLCLAAPAAGAALALAVASAGADVPTTASITAKDPYSFDNGSGGHGVTIAQGGTVGFGYPSGSTSHNVVFGGTQPTSCTDMPAAPAAQGWSGSCTFETPGTYAFHCGLHGSLMTGSVEVVDPDAPTTGTGPSPTDTGPGTNTNPPPANPPGGESNPPSVKVTRHQQGTVVHGSVTTPAGTSRIAVTAFTAKSALASRRARRVRIGSVTKRPKGAGTTSFALRVNRAARRALHRRGRLAVSLRVVITDGAGYALTRRKSVVLRERP